MLDDLIVVIAARTEDGRPVKVSKEFLAERASQILYVRLFAAIRREQIDLIVNGDLWAEPPRGLKSHG